MKKILILSLSFLLTFSLIFSYKTKLIIAEEIYPFNGVVIADSLVVHNARDTKNSSAVTELVYGSRIVVTEKSGNYYTIKYDNDKIGYVYGSLIINVDTNTLTNSISGFETYETYCANLGTSGFPESYCPYLYYLHVNHPTWAFKADKINMTLDEASKKEENKCVLQTNNSNYWLNGKYIEGNYYWIKASAIASFMDPRNSLFEKTIFQFLDSDDNKDLDAPNTLEYLVGKSGNLYGYLDTFKAAASKQGINVIQLVARSKQEGANTATYGSVSGTYTTDMEKSYPDKIKDSPNKYRSSDGSSLDGYYNFYNISAAASGTYTTVGHGLAYAAGLLSDSSCFSKDDKGNSYYDLTKCKELAFGRPWNTKEKAIDGGADFLASQYIRKGQDTTYYQKFNVSSYNTNDDFTNQYMTNSMAPAQESISANATYVASDSLELPFKFTIPVYNGMGDIYQAVDKDSDTSLEYIKINNELITGFDSDVTEYQNLKVLTNEDKITLDVKANKETTTIFYDKEISFNDNKANIDIKVVAEDGSEVHYILEVTQVLINPEIVEIKVSDILDKVDVKVKDNTIYGISPSTSISTLINTIVNNKGNAIIYDRNNKVKSSGDLVTGDIIEIKGTKESQKFTISVKGDLNGDGLVKINDLILVQSHILGKKKLEGILLYSADINEDGLIKINDLILVQSHILGKNKL